MSYIHWSTNVFFSLLYNFLSYGISGMGSVYNLAKCSDNFYSKLIFYVEL